MAENLLKKDGTYICLCYIQHRYLKAIFALKRSVNLRGFVTDFGMGSVTVKSHIRWLC